MSSERFLPESPVLVAESDLNDLGALKKVLREFQFRNVIYAEDAYKALHKGRFQPFALILLARVLAKGDGLKVLSSLRTEGKNKATPIVLLGSAAEHEVSETVVPKPFSEEALRRALEVAVGKKIVTHKDVMLQNRENLSATLSSLERAQQLLAQGDFEGAEAAFEEAMVTGGGSAEVFCGLAEVYLARGDTQNAEQVMAEAERIDPQARDKFLMREPIFLQRGKEDLKSGYFEEARRGFEGAILANQNSIEGHIGLGESLDALGDTEGARQAFERALEINDRPEDLRAYNRMGISARKRKDYEQAIRAYDKALSHDDKDPILYYNKSLVYVAQRKFEESLVLLKKSLELNPDFTEAKAARKTVLEALQKG